MEGIEPHVEGAVLPLRVNAGARRNELREFAAGRLRVAVSQIPEKGKANKAVLELLSKSLGLRKSQLELLAGESSSNKKLLVRGLSPEALRETIVRALES